MKRPYPVWVRSRIQHQRRVRAFFASGKLISAVRFEKPIMIVDDTEVLLGYMISSKDIASLEWPTRIAK